ncbi:Gfo/Idh/MocA family protein [Agromyces mangrovi Wang et al. 2018]|uniref:Gfo/Idh/MocA family protein n=1 Tax=Agromyces mangrovi TaxID=1858653 RepID=UPI0025728D77|nr:Gfo/Idh/MocA family oxidoreductase [Agromyces mangrovi]BDZ65358.1 oxidoreductase [Agromyces mangrovi]
MTVEPSPIRVGLVGAGFMGAKHARLVQRHPSTELMAVADPRPGAADAFDGASAFADHHELLAAGAVDAVVIANPNALHVDTAIDCLEAGVAVLVEKPVATSYLEARRLADAVARTAGTLLVGHHRRHHPSIAAARSVLAAGELGRIVAVSGMWAARKHDAYFDEEWHRSPGAGVMLINLIHDLDLLRHLLGEVTAVQATTGNAIRNLPVEDTAAVNLTFAGGAIGSFLATDAGASPWGWDQGSGDIPDFPFTRDAYAYCITGTAGALSIPDLAAYGYPAGVEGEWRRPMQRRYAQAAAGDSYSRQLDHFVEVVRGATAPIASAADAAESLALVEAARLAAERGATVELADFRDSPGTPGRDAR